MKPETKTS